MAASSTAQPPGVVKTLTGDKKRKRPVKKRRGKFAESEAESEAHAEAEAEAARSSKRRVPRARKNKNKHETRIAPRRAAQLLRRVAALGDSPMGPEDDSCPHCDLSPGATEKALERHIVLCPQAGAWLEMHARHLRARF
eukprot:jgi/Tetstr1/420820/TSEL_011896.t1